MTKKIRKNKENKIKLKTNKLKIHSALDLQIKTSLKHAMRGKIRRVA